LDPVFLSATLRIPLPTQPVLNKIAQETPSIVTAGLVGMPHTSAAECHFRWNQGFDRLVSAW
jgi:hypothetical protein